jgi:hypothetical protein
VPSNSRLSQEVGALARQPFGYVTEAMRAVGVYCPAKIVDVLPSKRCKQPPIIVSALPQDYWSLLLHKLADPTTRVQLSTSHGKVQAQPVLRGVQEAAGSLQGACGYHQPSTDTSGRSIGCWCLTAGWLGGSEAALGWS